MADILSIISLVSFIIAGVCLVLAIFLWFNFRIPRIIGDLSGRTARKSIAKMRAGNEASGSKSFRPSAVNVSRGKLTGTMPDLNKQQPQKADDAIADEIVTGVLAENKASGQNADQTALLEDNETGSLEEGAEAGLLDQMVAPAHQGGGKKLTMLDEVIQVHTDEVIE